MENKKTLWIIAAVGAFLLVVLGAAMIMYSPSSTKSTYARVAPVEKPLNGWSNPQSSYTTPAPIPEQLNGQSDTFADPVVTSDMFVVTNGDSVNAEKPTTIDLNSVKNNPAENQAQNINVTVTFADEQKAGAQIKKIIEKAPASTPAASAVTKKTAASTTKKTEAKKPAAAPAPKVPVVTKYWVQIAAYSNKKGAESARSELARYQITADIFTYKDNKDNLFYRVRIGPYTTKSEAEYWRQKLSTFKSFNANNCYVTSTEN